LALFRNYITARLTGFADAIERKSGWPDQESHRAKVTDYADSKRRRHCWKPTTSNGNYYPVQPVSQAAFYGCSGLEAVV
jgi:hypothetical protein